MENLEIAAVLKEFGDLLEIKGSNPFRIRAYRNAVRTIKDLTRSLASMVEGGEDLTELPGIGKEMANHIRELVKWGELEALEQLGEEVPRTLADLIRLGGVGPKKAKKLWEELGVTSVDELEVALEEDRVQGLDGFGKKSAEKIAQAIDDFRKLQGRFLLSEVDVLLPPLVAYLEKSPRVQRIEIAGSYRRRQETVGDADLLVLCESDAEEVMDRFRAYPGAVRTEASGPTKSRILLRSGLSVDLRVLPKESYGAALQYFSGSKEHNVAIRTLGVKKGLRINEYGVFEETAGTKIAAGNEVASPANAAGSEERPGSVGEGRRIAGETEESVYAAVGLPWIPPRLRENRGEVEAAAEGALPTVVTLDDIRGDLQMHSTWSDGAQSLREMVEACKEKGYEYHSITDHSQAVTVAGGLTPERVMEQWEEIDEIRSAVDGIHLYRSLEVDILKDGSLDMPDDILYGLDLLLVSVHSFMNMDGPTMTDRVIRGLEHPAVDILAHPTGRILNRRQPLAMDVDAVLQAAASLDVAVELNAHPSRLDLHDRHVRRAKELGVRVVISTDAHSAQDLSLMRYGVDQAARGWLEPKDVVNTLPLSRFEAWRTRRGKE